MRASFSFRPQGDFRPTLALALAFALAGCQPAGTAALTGSAIPTAALTTASLPTASIVHDGGIVFSRVPTHGFAIGGRLSATRVLPAGEIVRVRLILANGRSMLASPDAEGAFRFAVEPRGEVGFGIVSLRIERENGGSHPVLFATGAGQSQPWLKLVMGRSYDLGVLTRVDNNAKSSVNLLETLDADGDGIPDARDTDDDGDGIPDALEQGAFIYDPTESHDNDRDGLGDVRDTDDDNDGVPDVRDNDDDGDGVPDAIDPDDDNDGVPDVLDMPSGAGRIGDRDGDGIPDAEDRDADGNGIPDVLQILGRDTDNDGLADAYDTDPDGDGAIDRVFTEGLWRADADGDGVIDWLDVDGVDEPNGYGEDGAEDDPEDLVPVAAPVVAVPPAPVVEVAAAAQADAE